ncbi:MAG: haloacid dehalogenase [Desulfosalsimonadaceae bacterium]
MENSPKFLPQKLAFDIDGVFADTMTLFLEIAQHEFGLDTPAYEEIREYHFPGAASMDEAVATEILLKIVEGDYSLTLNPMGGATRVIRRLNRLCRPTLFVTARPSAEYIHRWLQEVLALGAEDIEVVATGSFEDKQDVLLRWGIQAFVEDRLETCFLLREAGISPIVYKQPWNRRPHPFFEVHNWRDIENLIAFE